MNKLKTITQRISKPFRSRVFLIWLLSYALIVAVSLIFFAIAASAIKNRVLEAYSDRSQTDHKQIEAQINQELNEIARQSYVLSHDSLINSFATLDPVRLPDHVKLKQIQDNLSAQAAVMSTDSQTMVVFANLGKVLSKETIYSLDSIWDEQLSRYSLDEAGWQALLAETHYNTLYLLDNIHTGKVQILNLTTCLFGQTRSKQSTIVQFYDSQYLDDLIGLFGAPDTRTRIVDASGRLIVGDSDPLWDELLAGDLLTPEHEGRTNVGDGPSEAVLYLSEISRTGWYLVTLLPAEVIDASTDWLQEIIVPLLLVYLLLGIALTFTMSQINYTPLDRLRRSLTACTGTDDNPAAGASNEYEYIQQRISHMQTNMSESRALLASTSTVMKQEFLTSALYRPLGESAVLREPFQKLGLTLDGDYFSVLMTMVYSDEPEHDMAAHQIFTEFLYYYSQSLIQTSAALAGTVPFFLETGHINVLLFNFDNEHAYDDLDQAIAGITYQQRRETPGQDIVVVMSRLVKGVDQIHQAYEACVEKMETSRKMLMDGIRAVPNTAVEQEMEEQDSDERFLDTAIKLVEQHYLDSDLNVSRIAEMMHCNVSTLSRRFKDQTGIGLLNYINAKRVNQAKLLLQDPDKLVGDVALVCGYDSANSFIRVFKKFEGLTPGAYQRKQLAGRLGRD